MLGPYHFVGSPRDRRDLMFARLGRGAPAPTALRLAPRPARVARLTLPRVRPGRTAGGRSRDARSSCRLLSARPHAAGTRSPALPSRRLLDLRLDVMVEEPPKKKPPALLAPERHPDPAQRRADVGQLDEGVPQRLRQHSARGGRAGAALGGPRAAEPGRGWPPRTDVTSGERVQSARDHQVNHEQEITSSSRRAPTTRGASA